MPRYNLPLVGLEISFKTDADESRIQAAKDLIEERYKSLAKNGSTISKEKLLACLALSLADDFLEESRRLRELDEKISRLLETGL